MPGFETMDLYQRATLWSATGAVDAYGQMGYTVPVEIPVRWNTSRKEIKRPDGTTVTLDGQAVVNQAVAVDSHIWLGRLTEWLGVGSSLPDNERMVVVGYNDTVDIKGRFTRRTLNLMRLHNRASN